LAVSVLILLYVADEHRYNGFHANGERIFIAMGGANYGGEKVNLLGMFVASRPTASTGAAGRGAGPGSIAGSGTERAFFQNEGERESGGC